MVYLDDVIVYQSQRCLEDHLTWLQAIFDHFVHHRLKLKPAKCHFFEEEITYLGHEISAKGILPRQKGIKEIAQIGPPYDIYRGQEIHPSCRVFPAVYIKNFTWIAKPLKDLLGLWEWQVEESSCLIGSCH